ncbi:MAG: sigma-70 family RNA polymerase sigma factor [Desulfococcaceae bacterium]|jgi:RNA polymerase sigma factor (sigma-70 family)|nr:sigma-70 family RNA polymerase sigma factor [Desulfococcaceae bacterium]
MNRLPFSEKYRMLAECARHNRCDEFVLHYWELVYGTVRKIFDIKNIPYDAKDIEDLRQEIFIRLLEKERKRLKAYDESKGAGIEGWLILISTRITLNYIRRKDPHSPGHQAIRIPIEEMVCELNPRQETDKAEARLLLSRIMEILPELPPTERLVFKLHYFDGLSFPEIEESLHKELGNIYVIRSRAMKKLKEMMDMQG